MKPFGEHCYKRPCPDGLPIDPDPKRQELMGQLGELGVQCPHIGTGEDGPTCTMGYALYRRLCELEEEPKPISTMLDMAHGVVDGDLPFHALPIPGEGVEGTANERWNDAWLLYHNSGNHQ